MSSDEDAGGLEQPLLISLCADLLQKKIKGVIGISVLTLFLYGTTKELCKIMETTVLPLKFWILG